MKPYFGYFARIGAGMILMRSFSTDLSAASAPVLAQVPPSLINSVQFALGVVFLFGFIWGVVKIWSGADRLSKGDADGKMGIVAGIIIAGAAAIMGALFAIFGMDGGVITPEF